MPWRSSVVLASLAVLAGCTQPVAPDAGGAIAAPLSADSNGTGRLAYERACAACHEQGVDGAPATGRPADWVGRSRLWTAVLAEHARRGYLGMPARGGGTELDDRTVQAAAEYMLTRTHPSRPPG